MATKLFNVWPAEGYMSLVLPEGKSYERVSRLQHDPEPLIGTWAGEDFVLAGDDPVLRRPDISKTSVICLPTRLAESVMTDRRGLELLAIRVEGEDWSAVHSLGVVDSSLHLASSEVLPTTVPKQYVFKWVNLVHPKPLPGEVLRLRGSVYGPHVTESFVDRIEALGLKGLQFELIGHVIADASQAIPKPTPAPTPAPRGKRLRQPKLTTKTLAPGELEELREAGEAMRRRLHLDAQASAEEALQTLTASLHRLRLTWFHQGKEEQVATLLGLSAVYGQLICNTHGWSWVELRQAGGRRWVAVAPPDATHALAVLPYIRQQIDSQAPTVTLLFNMIGAGQLPPAESGQVVSIG